VRTSSATEAGCDSGVVDRFFNCFDWVVAGVLTDAELWVAAGEATRDALARVFCTVSRSLLRSGLLPTLRAICAWRPSAFRRASVASLSACNFDASISSFIFTSRSRSLAISRLRECRITTVSESYMPLC
jgi:hypothetical protein